MRNILAVALLFASSFLIQACVGDEELRVERSVSALLPPPPDCGGDYTCEFTGSDQADNICILSAGDPNDPEEMTDWICAKNLLWGTWTAMNITNATHLAIFTGLGNDTVVIRSSDAGRCSCSCPATIVSGPQHDYRFPNPPQEFPWSSTNMYDTPMWDGGNNPASGNDRFFLSGDSSIIHNVHLSSGSNLAVGWDSNDGFESTNAPAAAVNSVWDLGGLSSTEDVFGMGPGIDNAFDNSCQLSSCTLGAGNSDKTNCPNACAGEEIVGYNPPPACPVGM